MKLSETFSQRKPSRFDGPHTGDMRKTRAPALRGCAVALLLACLVGVTVAQPRVGGAPTVSQPVIDKIRVRLQQKKDLVIRNPFACVLPAWASRGLGPPVQQCN
jgi:hypothetical protein